jgi:hypothetical protein
MLNMQLSDREAVDFLSGNDTVRDGYLIGLALAQGENEWDVVLHLTFMTRKSHDARYTLTLTGGVSFDYDFSNETVLSQIAFVKCLWTEDGAFYLSLDPWKESERFVCDQDADWFRSKSALLTVSRPGD